MRCQTCKKEIVGRRKDTIYCIECARKRKNQKRQERKAANAPPATRYCKHCEKHFPSTRRSTRMCEPCRHERREHASQHKYARKRKPLLRVCPDCNSTKPWHKPSTKVCEPCKRIRLQKKKKPPQIKAHVVAWSNYYAQLKKKVSCLKCRCQVSFTACLECDVKTPKCACYRPSHNAKMGIRSSVCYGCIQSYNKRLAEVYNYTYYKKRISRKHQETIERDLQKAIIESWYRYINKSAYYKIPRSYIKLYKNKLINKYGYKRCRQCGASMDSTDKYCVHCLQVRREHRRACKKRLQVKQRSRELISLHNTVTPCQDGKYLYIITDGIYYKVGISQNPHQRIRGLRRKQGASNLSLIGIYKVLTARAIDTERVIHKQLSPFNISYQYPSGVTSLEWFEAPLSIIKSCVHFHTIKLECII